MILLLSLLLFQFSPKSWGTSASGAVTAPPAYVTSCSAGVGAGNLTTNCNIPSFVSGHAAVVMLTWTGTVNPTTVTMDATTLTANPGNDLSWATALRNTKAYVLCGVAAGSHTFTVTFPSNQTQIVIAVGEYSGANPTTCLDTQSVISTTGAAPYNCTPVTTTTPYETAIVFGGTVSAVAVQAAGSGYTLRSHPGGVNPYAYTDGAIAAAGTSTPTMSSPSATAAYCSVVVIKS